jgi:hypothetical protein
MSVLADDDVVMLHAPRSGMAGFADNDMIVHGDAERGSEVDDRFRHLDVRPRGRRRSDPR